MSRNAALSFLAGLGSGAMQGHKMREDSAAREEDRKAREEDRAYVRENRKRESDLRTGLADAYAPVKVEGEVYQPTVDDDGGAMPVNPTAGVYRVGMQKYVNQTEADKAAVEYNKPEAQTERAAGVHLRMGDVAGARAVRSGAREDKLNDLKLGEAERAHLGRVFTDNLAKHGTTWKGFTDYMSESPLGGVQQKFTHRPSADGKKMGVYALGADGAETPMGEFANSAEGLLTARTQLNNHVPDSEKLRAAYAAKDDARKDADSNSKNKLNEEHAGYYKAAAAAAGVRAEKTGGSAFERMPEVVRLQFQDAGARKAAIHAKILKIQGDAAEVGAKFDPNNPVLMVLKDQYSQAVKQQADLITAYQDDGVDRLGVRNLKGSTAAATPTDGQGAPGDMAQVVAAMKRNGDTEADVQLGGGPRVRMSSVAQANTGQTKAKPAAKAAPAAQTDPLKGLTRQGLREKREQLLGEIKRWGAQKGGEGIVSEAQALIDRIDNGQY